MTLPYTLANGVGNYPDAAKFNSNYEYLEVLARQNRIINGNFSINQRQLTSVGDDAYCLDRWYVLTQTGNVTVAQMTDQETGTPTNIKLTQPDVTAKRIGLAQIIESINIRDLQSGAATLTARIKCSASQPIRYAIIGAGSNDSVTSDIVGDWTNPTYVEYNFLAAGVYAKAIGSITPTAGTWTNISLVCSDMGTSGNFVVFFWTEGTLAQNGTLEIARVALRPGSAVVHGESFRDTVTELLLCQRYYEKSIALSIAPGASTMCDVMAGTVSGTAMGGFIATYHFAVEKRATPTTTVYDLVGNSGKISTWTGGLSTNNVTPSNPAWYISTRAVQIYHIPSVAGIQCYVTVNAEL